jgi:hypothetical protein
MTTDVVGIYDEDFNQLVPEGRPIKASIVEPSKLMEHPLEDGSTVVDHRILQPAEVELTIIADHELWQRYYAIYGDAELVTIQTKSTTYDNMVIESINSDETPDVFDRVPIVLKFKEVVFVETQFQALPPTAVAKKTNASTVKRGEQTGKPTAEQTQKKASVLYGLVYGGG